MSLEEDIQAVFVKHGVKCDARFITDLVIAFTKWQQVTLLAIYSRILRRMHQQEQRIIRLEEATGIEGRE